MDHTVFNPQKGRLETISVDFTDENTTWFKNCRKSGDIEMITDYKKGELLGQGLRLELSGKDL